MTKSADDHHIYIFHHVPKCGGTSMKRALGKWFRRKRDYRPPWAEGKRLERFRRRPLDLAAFQPGTIVCGHFEVEGIYLHQRYPQALDDPRFRLVTFVREPLELRLSLLRHEIDHRRLSGAEPLEELLLGRRNWLAHRFPLTAENLDEVLGRYFFIGTMDDLHGSWDALADRLGKPRVRLPHLNRSRPRQLAVSEELEQRFRQVHALDYRVYRRCQQLSADALPASD